MVTLKNQSKVLHRINIFFIVAGLLELFLFIFLTNNVITGIVGVITLVPAYIAVSRAKYRWNYFTGVWAIVKYNPITASAIAFILGGMLHRSDVDNNLNDSIIIIAIVVSILLAVASLILGVIILIKTARYNNALKSEGMYLER